MSDVVLDAPSLGRPTDLSGPGFLGGTIPVVPSDEDGRARILNEPARVKIRVFESRTNRLVAATVSDPDGSWRVEGLALDVPFRVIGVDPARQVNSAIQDWVYAAPMGMPVRFPYLESRFPPAHVGSAWRGVVRLHDADADLDSVVVTGMPAWMSAHIFPDGVVLDGVPTTAGDISIAVTGMVGTSSVSIAADVSVRDVWFGIKLVVTSNNGDPSWLGIAEISPRDSGGMRVGIAPGSVVAFSSQYTSSADAAANAFDNVAGTYWYPATLPSIVSPHWVSCTFPAPVSVAKVGMLSVVNNGAARMPRDFEIYKRQASGDWVLAKAYSNVTDWAVQVWKEFDV